MPTQFEKRRERHAIGEFSAVIRFFQPLDTDAFSIAVGALRSFAREQNLPAPINAKTFTINIDGVSASPMPVTSSAGWQRYAPDGEPELSVVCEPSAITYTSRCYTTWDDMLPKLLDFFGQIVPHYISSVPGVTSLQVRYLNEFRSLSTAADSGKELFRDECVWLPRRFCQFQDAWHSHAGAFEDVSEVSRRLININVDCVTTLVDENPNPATIITILFLVANNFDLPGRVPLVVSEKDLGSELKQHFDELHRREKELLAELLADEYLEAIGAKDKVSHD